MPEIKSVLNALPINWTLIKNPVNWIIVFLMVAIAGAGIAVIFSATQSQED